MSNLPQFQLPNSSNEDGRTKFDSQAVIGKILQGVRFARLGAILFCIGLLLGLGYFVYGNPLFESTSLVNLRVYGLPISEETGEEIKTPSHAIRKTLLQQLNSPNLMADVAVKLGVADSNDSPELIRENVIPKFRVSFLDNDYLQVSVLSYDPYVVREFPDTLIKVFDEQQTELRAQFREKALTKYRSELSQIREKIDSHIAERSGFEEGRDLAQLLIEQSELNNVPREVIASRERLARAAEADAALAALGDSPDPVMALSVLSRFEEQGKKHVGGVVRQSGNDKALPLRSETTLVSPLLADRISTPGELDPVYPWQELEKERRVVELELEATSKTYLPGHEVVVALRQRLDEISRSLNSELVVARKRFAIEKKTLERRIQELDKLLPDYHRVTRDLARTTSDYKLLESGEVEWTKAYDDMSEKIASLEFGEDKKRLELEFQGMTSLRDIDPVSPSKKKLAILGILAGSLLGIGVPLVLGFFDTTTTQLGELEEALGIPGIGVVPLTDQTDLENVVRSPSVGATVPNFLLENFRVIRSNVLLNPGRHGRSKVIMVTSARPSEGKTTQAANLAWAFYSMGEKTLLIDCDLRRGRQHKLLDLSNEKGLTTLFSGQCSADEIVQKTDIEDLDVITRGPVIVGTTESLFQEGFKKLLDGWEEKYDRIVLDSPPTLGLSETVSLQNLADGIVFVVRAERTRRKDLLDATKLLKKSGAHFFGFVLNGIDLSKMHNYYSYYYYSAGYYEQFEVEEVAKAKS